MFELENMQIDGMENEKIVQVKVPPGREQLINIIQVNEGERKLSVKVFDKKITVNRSMEDAEENEDSN